MMKIISYNFLIIKREKYIKDSFKVSYTHLHFNQTALYIWQFRIVFSERTWTDATCEAIVIRIWRFVWTVAFYDLTRGALKIHVLIQIYSARISFERIFWLTLSFNKYFILSSHNLYSIVITKIILHIL